MLVTSIVILFVSSIVMFRNKWKRFKNPLPKFLLLLQLSARESVNQSVSQSVNQSSVTHSARGSVNQSASQSDNETVAGPISQPFRQLFSQTVSHSGIQSFNMLVSEWVCNWVNEPGWQEFPPRRYLLVSRICCSEVTHHLHRSCSILRKVYHRKSWSPRAKHQNSTRH